MKSSAIYSMVCKRMGPNCLFGLMLVLGVLIPREGWALTPPTFGQSLEYTNIGPGSVSRLTYTITNVDSVDPANNLEFSTAFPAGMVIAAPANAWTDCVNGILSAEPASGTLGLTNARVGTISSCTVVVDVTAASPGTYNITSGALTSDAGSSGTSNSTLTVNGSKAGFTKAFAPSEILLGETSTLTFTIDNAFNGSSVNFIQFTDTFPEGMVIADVPNLGNDCPVPLVPSTFTAEPGTAFFGAQINYIATAPLDAGQACHIWVDVTPTVGGSKGNTTSVFSGNNQMTGGRANAVLDVMVPNLMLTFSDQVLPGEDVDLEFTLTNLARDLATNISFTDDLDAVITGLAPSGGLPSSPCGAGSSLSFSGGELSFSGGELGEEASCTFTVTLSVPGGTATGSYLNTTSTVNVDIGGAPRTWDPGQGGLVVGGGVEVELTYTDSPVAPGANTTASFTVTNTDPVADATDITFGLTTTPLFSTPSSLPASGFCGAGSTASLTVGLDGNDDAYGVRVSIPNLVSGDSCTFDVDLTVVSGTSGGAYTTPTTTVSAKMGGVVQGGDRASAELVVVAAPVLSKSFTDDPVAPGSSVTLQYTLSLDENAVDTATNVSFTDDLNSALSGLVATGLPLSDVCGAGSSLAGTDTITLSGASLGVNNSCTFGVTLDVPVDAASGDHLSATSAVSATVLGLDTNEQPAQDVLQIAGLVLSTEYVDDTALPGDRVTLRFTLENTDTLRAVTQIAFSTNLGDTMVGMTAPDLPASGICGSSSSITGPSTLNFTNGELVAGDTCTFDVTVEVPTNVASGEYTTRIALVSADAEGTPIDVPGASATLFVIEPMLFTKAFANNVVSSGGTLDLEFEIANNDPVNPATNITFADDLDAALSGLVATGLPLNEVCGAGSQLSGTSTLTLTGGNLTAGTSCTITVPLQFPSGVAAGSQVHNITSSLTGLMGGTAVTAAAAEAAVQVTDFDFTLAFPNPIESGDSGTVVFTIKNNGAGASDIRFSDDLGATISGLVASGLPRSNVCGTGSQLTGSSVLSLTGGALAQGESCSFTVEINVPPSATPGEYLNETSSLGAQGLTVASSSSATLTVTTPMAPPAFGKIFAPDVVGLGEVSRLSLIVNNTGNESTVSALAFTDNLPSGLRVADPANSEVTCTGGELVADPGSSVVSYQSGAVPGGTSCFIAVDVLADQPGSYLNSTSLTSLLGLSGTASDELIVAGAPELTISFGSELVLAGDTVELAYTLSYPAASPGAASDIAFLNDLDSALGGLTAVTLPQGEPCGPGSQLSGTDILTLTGGALQPGESCTFSVTLQVPSEAVAGEYLNTTSEVTASIPSMAVTNTPASDVLAVAGLTLNKTFLDNPATPGSEVALAYELNNTDPTRDATAIGFSDDLGSVLAGLSITSGALTDPCGPGSSATVVGNIFELQGGNVATGQSCTIEITVQLPSGADPGDYPSTTSTISASIDGSSVVSSAATDTLTVESALSLTKTFMDASAAPGDSVELSFTVTNNDMSQTATNVAFNDSLGDALSGLVATDAKRSNICGTGSEVRGSDVLILSGGTLGPGESCTFSSTLQVPETAVLGSTVTNVTSVVSGTLDGSVQFGNQATAELAISYLAFSKLFGGVVTPGSNTQLTFTLENHDPSNAVAGLSFSDDLDLVLAGLVADGTGQSDICGSGSQLGGTSLLAFSDGSLAAGEQCSFAVSVEVPQTAAPGEYLNRTSQLLVEGLPTSVTAFAQLTVAVAPEFSMHFDASQIANGEVTTLVFGIDNSANVVSTEAMSFSTQLVAGLSFTDPLRVTTDCDSNNALVQADMERLALTRGSVGAGRSCEVTVDVMATQVGEISMPAVTLNTSLGSSQAASATLSVSGAAVTESDAGTLQPPAGNDGGSSMTPTNEPEPAAMEPATQPGANNTPDAGTAPNGGMNNSQMMTATDAGDAGVDAGADAGAGSASSDSGCGCRMVGEGNRRSSPWRELAAMLLALGVVWRRTGGLKGKAR